jgi:hypothetical protein
MSLRNSHPFSQKQAKNPKRYSEINHRGHRVFPTFYDSFNRIKNFLPKEVKRFWEEDIGDGKNHN